MNSHSAPMMRAERVSGDRHCPYGCCTDWPPGGRAGRSQRRILRTRTGAAWRKDVERNPY